MPVQTDAKGKREGKVLLQVWVDGDLRDAIRDSARENGLTLQSHVSELLGQAMTDIEGIDGESSPKMARNVYHRMADAVEEMISEVQRLHKDRDALEQQIREKTGWYENPPESLVKARDLLDARLRKLTQRCDELAVRQQITDDDDEVPA